MGRARRGRGGGRQPEAGPAFDDLEGIGKEPRHRGSLASAHPGKSGDDGQPLLQRLRRRPCGGDARGLGFRSDCTLRLSSGIILHAEGRAHEPYPCFEQAADKIERRLRRYKTRLKGHGVASAANERGKVANYVIEQPDEDEEEPADGFNPAVVAEGTEELKSLSVASAVAELDLTGVNVVVFQHAGSGRVNVVYRRRDGAIGWLDPQAPRNPPRAD